MKNLLTLSIIIIFGLFSLPAARSQENTQILLTWQANNFYPADYQGKPLPTPNSRVTVALEVLKNNKFLNLNQANIFWLLDDKPLDNGRGLKEVSFVVKKREGDNHVVRVTVQLENQNLESLIRIPISKKIIVIENSHSDKPVPANSEITLRAIPYFFNIASLNDLSFSWQADTEKETNLGDNHLVLKIGQPKTLEQSSILISSFVQNVRNPLEFAEAKLKLSIF